MFHLEVHYAFKNTLININTYKYNTLCSLRIRIESKPIGMVQDSTRVYFNQVNIILDYRV